MPIVYYLDRILFQSINQQNLYSAPY